MWGKQDVADLISKTIPPGEEKQGFDDRMLFIETLSMSIALKKDGKLLFDGLREKWPDEVQSSLMEASLLANEQIGEKT
jgi:hypothetical protein